MLQYIRNNKGILGFFIFMLAFKSFAYNGTFVPTGSMKPTIDDKSFVIVNTHAYGIKVPFTKITLISMHDPERNDIAVFRMPKDEKTNYVKRIVAIPGDTLYYNEHEFHVNATPANPEKFTKIVIPEDKYFAIGDNIEDSYDSRYWGFIPKENFIGKYEFRAFGYKFLNL